MILVEIKSLADNPYTQHFAVLAQAVSTACQETLGVAREEVYVLKTTVQGAVENRLFITMTLPQKYSAVEKTQLSGQLQKNLFSALGMRQRDAAVSIYELPPENLGGIWSVR